MRRKGYPHGELSDEEKVFFDRRKTSILERRRERLERKAAEEDGSEEKIKSEKKVRA